MSQEPVHRGRRLTRPKAILDWPAYEETMYGTPHMQVYLQTRNDAVVRMIESKFPGDREVKILDVGHGTGLTYSHVAASSPRFRVFGADLSVAMIARAKEKIERVQTARITRTSALRLPFADRAFEMVYATRFIHQFRNKDQVLDEFRRVTKPGGLIAVEFYARPYHWFRYHTENIAESADAFFSHFPTRAQVRALVGHPHTRIPLRPAGARFIRRLFGDTGLRWITRSSAGFPLSMLVDEYFLVFSNGPAGAPR